MLLKFLWDLDLSEAQPYYSKINYMINQMPYFRACAKINLKKELLE